MADRLLHIFVEGTDDKRFFEKIIKPMFEVNYDSVVLQEYQQKKDEWVVNFLKSIKSMGSDYIYAGDINSQPCVTAKKRKIKEEFRNLDESRIIVVVKEIESWYLAGLSDKDAKKFKIPLSKIRTTDDLTKEQFNGLIPERFKDSRIDLMIELLKCFSVETAKQRNKSFNHFIGSYVE